MRSVKASGRSRAVATARAEPGRRRQPASASASRSPDNRWARPARQSWRALGDPVRLRLISLIGAHQGGEVCVCDLTAAFDLTQTAISHHLKVLREAGIVDCERLGTWAYYWLVPAALGRMSSLLSLPSS